MYEEVRRTRTVDALRVSDVRAHAGVADTADERQAAETGVQKALSTRSLSHPAGRIARTEERDGADGAVLEAAEQSVTEVDEFRLLFDVLGRSHRSCTHTAPTPSVRRRHIKRLSSSPIIVLSSQLNLDMANILSRKLTVHHVFE